MTRPSHLLAALLLGLMATTGVRAAAPEDDVATPAEAQDRLKAIVGAIKAKGAATAAQQVMAADDPLKCKYKDMVCLVIVTADGTFLANTGVPKMVGSKFPPDMVDVDGAPIIAAQLTPARQGKQKWDAKYKFSRPGAKKVVPRWSFCEKADEANVACVVVGQS